MATPLVRTLVTALHGKMGDRDRAVSIRILGNLSLGTDWMVRKMINQGMLAGAEKSLSSGSELVLNETCWLLSNVAAGSEEDVESLLQCPRLIDQLTELLRTGGANVRKEICYIFSNMSRALEFETYFQLLQRVEMMETVVELLGDDDPRFLKGVLVSLECLIKHFANDETWLQRFKRLFGRCRGIHRLQQLQYNDDNEVYGMVSRLISSYFDIDDSFETGEDYLPTEPTSNQHSPTTTSKLLYKLQLR